ncbi:MAG TPA: hypothetical protein VFZ44_02295 [Pyrinomonadaceae bacterium]
MWDTCKEEQYRRPITLGGDDRDRDDVLDSAYDAGWYNRSPFGPHGGDVARPAGLKRFGHPLDGIMFLRFLPWGKRAGWGYRWTLDHEVERQLRAFNALQSVNVQDKARIFCSIERHVELLKTIEMRGIMAAKLLFNLTFVVAALLVFVGGPPSLYAWLGVPQTFGGWALTYVLYWLALAAGLALSVLPEIIFPTISTKLAALWAGVVLLVYLGVICYALTSTDIGRAGMAAQLVVAGMAGVFVLFALCGAVLVLGVFISHTLKRWAFLRHPDSVLVTGLLIILSAAEHGPSWTSLGPRLKLLRRLEDVARCVQYALPRRLGDKDFRTNVWVRARSRGIADGLRSLKRWVSTPKPDTRALFVARVSDALVHAALGEWDALPRAKAGKLSRPNLVSRAFAVIRGLVVGLLPLMILVVVQRSSMPLHGDVLQYAVVGTLLWAALALLGALDPGLGTKLENFKGIASSILPKRP